MAGFCCHRSCRVTESKPVSAPDHPPVRFRSANQPQTWRQPHHKYRQDKLFCVLQPLPRHPAMLPYPSCRETRVPLRRLLAGQDRRCGQAGPRPIPCCRYRRAMKLLLSEQRASHRPTARKPILTQSYPNEFQGRCRGSPAPGAKSSPTPEPQLHGHFSFRPRGTGPGRESPQCRQHGQDSQAALCATIYHHCTREDGQRAPMHRSAREPQES